METILSSYPLATSWVMNSLNKSMLMPHYIFTLTILLLSGSLLYAQDPGEPSLINFKDTSQAVSPNDQWLEEEALSESMLKNMFIEQCNQNGDMLLYCMCTYNNIITEFGSLLDMPESFIESSDFQTRITFPCMEYIDITQTGPQKTQTKELDDDEQMIRDVYMMSCDPDGDMTDFCDCTYQNLSAKFGPMLDSPDGYFESEEFQNEIVIPCIDYFPVD